MTEYEGKTKEEAMLRAAFHLCSPCCPYYGYSRSGHNTSCCGVLHTDTLRATITGGTAIDGTHTLTWTDDPAIYLRILTGPGWILDLTYQFTCIDRDYAFMLAFDPSTCNFLWYQFEKITGGLGGGEYLFFRSKQYLYPGGFCIIDPTTCNPFHVHGGLVSPVISGVPQYPLKDCSTFELDSSCTPDFTGPVVEITL